MKPYNKAIQGNSSLLPFSHIVEIHKLPKPSNLQNIGHWGIESSLGLTLQPKFQICQP